VLDPLDLCPGTPAGHLPDPARAGCPTPDRDRDTVADAVDRCPDQPGIPSADPARHGCPDIIRIENGRLLLTQPVHFRRARADIGRRSIPLLEQVAEALRLAPHIRRMSLDGHTDDRGDDAANLALSQARMNSVRDWLIARGVAPDRLEAHGYGETRPLVPNDSARNRALNRRVEFIILDPPLGGAAQAAPVTPSGDETAERSHSRRRHRRRR
jgi:outer membrane protein OmpA-like peptidoglycan-associated protein